jgi:C4-type Zn-finger protein
MDTPICCKKWMELKAVSEVWNIRRTNTVTCIFFQCNKCGNVHREWKSSGE